MNPMFQQSYNQEERIKELQLQVVAAEMHLTHFAAKKGKESAMYQESLREFALAWSLLKKNRSPEDFLEDALPLAV